MDAAVSSLGTVSRAIMNNLVNGPGQTPMRAPQLTRPRADTLRIAVPSILASTLIAPALPRFMQQHLEIGVRLFTGLQPSAPFVATGEASLCLCTADTTPTLPALRVATLREIVCASHEFIDAHGEPRSPTELDPSHCIGVLDAGPEPTIWKLRRGRTHVAIEPASAMTFDDVHSAAAAAVHAGGFVCLPDLAVESQIAAGLLQPVLRDWRGCDRSVWITYDGALTEALHQFAVFVKGLLTSKRSSEEKWGHSPFSSARETTSATDR
jgi:DNA-binding transcriptional LysR family regulator